MSAQAKAQPVRRQDVRKAILAGTFLLFEYRLFHLLFSPVLLLFAASQGILSASLLLYGALFASSLLLGRAWCGWACPGTAINEACSLVIRKRPATATGYWIKYALCALFLGGAGFLLLRAGTFPVVDPFFGMSRESATQDFIMLFGAACIIAPTAALWGRHAQCHYFCWIAPLLILGTKLKETAGWPSLRIAADPEKCQGCVLCRAYCPMNIDIKARFGGKTLSDPECILCGNCVDHCPSRALRFTFSPPPDSRLARFPKQALSK